MISIFFSKNSPTFVSSSYEKYTICSTKTNKGSTITRKTFDIYLFKLRAEDGTQTRDPQLGNANVLPMNQIIMYFCMLNVYWLILLRRVVRRVVGVGWQPQGLESLYNTNHNIERGIGRITKHFDILLNYVKRKTDP